MKLVSSIFDHKGQLKRLKGVSDRWHGYPEGHPNHKGEQLFRSARTGAERCVKNADLYAKTEADTQAYPAGYTVWSKCGGMTSRRWNGATGCSRASSSGARRECGCVVCGTVYAMH